MRARLNALAQMKIVISAGTVDPFSYQKCCLFIAQAQMQEGLLKQSKAIIQKVFKHNQHQDSDASKRLVRMCQGLWSRLRKFYLDEREQKEKHKTVPSIVAC